MAHLHKVDDGSAVLKLFFEQLAERFKLMLRHLHAILLQHPLQSGLGHIALALGESLVLLQTSEDIFPLIRKLLSQALLAVNLVHRNETIGV